MSIRDRRRPTARVSTLLTGLLMLGVVGFQAHAFDVTGRSTDPVKVQADWAELDERTGESLYRGNVVVQQGRSLVEAQEIRIRAGEDGIDYFLATGEPAHMLIFDSEKNEETHAYARSMEYERAGNRVTLQEGARVQQASSSFQGERIIYNTLTQVVNAESRPGGNGSGRVEIIYHPKKGDGTP